MGLSRVGMALEYFIFSFENIHSQLKLTKRRAHIFFTMHDKERCSHLVYPGEGIADGINLGFFLRRAAVTRFDKDLTQTVCIGIGIAKVVDTGHGYSCIKGIGYLGDGGHRGDAAIAVAIDAHFAIRPALLPDEGGRSGSILGLTVTPVVGAEPPR